MRVVLDTNILVSGLLSPQGNCSEILSLLRQSKLEACYSTAILIEYLRVLERPQLGLDPADVDAILDQIEKDGVLVSAPPLEPLRDATDTKFLEAAVAGRAAHLVTGNLKDFPAPVFGGVTIVGPTDFLKIYWALLAGGQS